MYPQQLVHIYGPNLCLVSTKNTDSECFISCSNKWEKSFYFILGLKTIIHFNPILHQILKFYNFFSKCTFTYFCWIVFELLLGKTTITFYCIATVLSVSPNHNIFCHQIAVRQRIGLHLQMPNKLKKQRLFKTYISTVLMHKFVLD